MNDGGATTGTRPGVPEAISRSRVIAIGRRLDPSTVPSIGAALASGGIRAFEVTMNSESALEVIGELAKRFSPDELLVGAGTVFTVAPAEGAVEAGARFLVMPHLDTAIVGWAADRDRLPGTRRSRRGRERQPWPRLGDGQLADRQRGCRRRSRARDRDLALACRRRQPALNAKR